MDRKVRRTVLEGRTMCGLLAMAGIAITPPARAALDLQPYVSAQVEHDDNVFRTHHDTIDDTIARYAAGGELHYDVGQQDAWLKGEFQHYDFHKLNDLDFNGNLVQGGWNWKVGSIADGTLQAGSERRLESFATRTGSTDDTSKGLQRETTVGGTANLRMTPRWELRLRGDSMRLRNSLDTSEQLDRNESSGTVGIGYLGLPISSVGFEVGYAGGNYPKRHADITPDQARAFQQTSYQLTAMWRPSGISTIEAKAGYTERDNDGVGHDEVDDFSGATGRVSYLRTISPKTSFNIQVFRDVQSIEFIGENAVARLGASTGFNWKPTPDTSLDAAYTYSHDVYQDNESEHRKDHVHYASLVGRWEMIRYLYLTPSLAWEKRTSNDGEFTYDDFRAMIGLELRYKLF